MAKTIQSGRIHGRTLGNLEKKVLQDLAIRLTWEVLPKIATRATLSEINVSEEPKDDIITWIKILVMLHLLTIMEVTKYFNYKPRFNDMFSRDN